MGLGAAPTPAGGARAASASSAAAAAPRTRLLLGAALLLLFLLSGDAGRGGGGGGGGGGLLRRSSWSWSAAVAGGAHGGASAPARRASDFAGCVYVYYPLGPVTGHLGGGPETLQTLSWSLNQLGVCSRFHLPSKQVVPVDLLDMRADSYFAGARVREAPRMEEAPVWPPPTLSANDVAIFSEGMAGEPVPRAVFEAQARGARVLFMVMGLHQPRDYYKFFANHTVFTISEGLSRMVGALALQPLWRPLQRSIYDAAAAWRALRP
jgi:hypothetical protein